MGRHLEWNEIYAFQKVFPLLTRWQMKQSATQITHSSYGFVVPSFIKKTRNPKAVPSYEIVWKDEHNYFRDLFPDEQLRTYLVEHECDVESLWSTIEPADLVSSVYPSLVEEFEAAKLAKKKKPKAATRPKKNGKSPAKKATAGRAKKTKASDSLSNFSQMQAELETIAVPKSKPGKKKKTTETNIDKYFKIEGNPNKADDSIISLPDCDNDDLENIQDLSNLILGIVNRSPIVKRIQNHDLIYAEYSKEFEAPKNEQSMDDIDMLIMRKATGPKHKRISSLRTDLFSSTPNSKHVPGPSTINLHQEHEQSLFFSPASEQDLFESSYNALIGSELED